MFEISERSMQALMQSQQNLAQAQAQAAFVAQTIVDAYELPGPIIGIDPKTSTVRCELPDPQPGPKLAQPDDEDAL